ncbi:MAG TPA: hypothetical protein VIK50_10820 [Gemmatimonadaceae bacterium]
MRFRRVIGAWMVALLATSCSLGSTAEAGSINLYLEVDKGTLPIGETMTITVTARNVGYDPLTLTGPSDCLLYVDVLDNQGSVVWNSKGGCAGSTVTEEIVAGQDKIQSFFWNGTSLAGARLASGFYHIRGVAQVTGAAYVGPLLSISLE